MAKTMPRIKKVPITIIEDGQEKEKTIVVQKAGLGKWKQITDSLKKLENILPEIIEKKGYENPDEFLENITTIDLAGLLPELFAFAVDEIIHVLDIATEADKEFIEENVGPDEALELFFAVSEVNRLYKVAEMGKKLPFLKNMMGAPQQTKRSTTKNSSTALSGKSKS